MTVTYSLESFNCLSNIVNYARAWRSRVFQIRALFHGKTENSWGICFSRVNWEKTDYKEAVGRKNQHDLQLKGGFQPEQFQEILPMKQEGLEIMCVYVLESLHIH